MCCQLAVCVLWVLSLNISPHCPESVPQINFWIEMEVPCRTACTNESRRRDLWKASKTAVQQEGTRECMLRSAFGTLLNTSLFDLSMLIYNLTTDLNQPVKLQWLVSTLPQDSSIRGGMLNTQRVLQKINWCAAPANHSWRPYPLYLTQCPTSGQHTYRLGANASSQSTKAYGLIYQRVLMYLLTSPKSRSQKRTSCVLRGKEKKNYAGSENHSP